MKATQHLNGERIADSVLADEDIGREIAKMRGLLARSAHRPTGRGQYLASRVIFSALFLGSAATSIWALYWCARGALALVKLVAGG